MDNETKRAIIMENYTHPLNRKTIDDASYVKVNTRNVSCIDNINLYIKFNEKRIVDMAFDGEACAISISATSVMLNNLIGKTKEEALEYIHNFYHMTEGESYNEELLKDGNAYSDIYKQGNRKTCATLPFRGLEKAILESEK